MTLAELIERLDDLNDALVEAENAYTDDGGDADFDHLHTLLGEMRQVVVDRQNAEEDGMGAV